MLFLTFVNNDFADEGSQYLRRQFLYMNIFPDNIKETAVFINLSYTGSSDSALAYLADYVPCFLVNDCLVCILET